MIMYGEMAYEVQFIFYKSLKSYIKRVHVGQGLGR